MRFNAPRNRLCRAADAVPLPAEGVREGEAAQRRRGCSPYAREISNGIGLRIVLATGE